MRIEKNLEMRGLKRQAFIDYFISIAGQSAEDGKYAGVNWEVQIYPQTTCKLGSFLIPSVKITFIAEEDIIEAILYKFRLKFLCAGG